MISHSSKMQHVHFIEVPEDVSRTVFINDYGEPPVDFQISKGMKDLLYESGYQATWEYLNAHDMITDLNAKNPFDEWSKGTS